jgi:NADP-dependent 3-hydroxy acid dehydrogenase YdfG
MCKTFEGKAILITGGTSGIGLALAEAFIHRGASMAVCARSRTALESFRKAHPQALAIEADVTDLRIDDRRCPAAALPTRRLAVLGAVGQDGVAAAVSIEVATRQLEVFAGVVDIWS